MLIRRANIADIPDLTRLLVQVCNVHQAIRPDIFRPDGVKYTPDDLKALLRDETRPIWCAVEDGKLLGYCFCQWREYRNAPVSTDRKELYIDDLCVEEGARGLGVATALYRHAASEAKAAGAAFLTLNVWCGNEPALAFYEKMGLRPRNMTMEYRLEE